MKGEVFILVAVVALVLAGCSTGEGNLITGNTVLDSPEEITEPQPADEGIVSITGGTVQRVDFNEGEE